MVVVSLDVRNTGPVSGAAVVQIYVSQRSPSINRPVKELKGFSKVYLEPGETKTGRDCNGAEICGELLG
jgi:beta-glucosidase